MRLLSSKEVFYRDMELVGVRLNVCAVTLGLLAQSTNKLGEKPLLSSKEVF